jgi:hypothetical protein
MDPVGDDPEVRIDGIPDGPPAGPPLPPPPPVVPQPPPPPGYAQGMGGAFGAMGPMGPYRPAIAPVVSDAVLAIPLGTRELVRQSLDLLTRRDTGLRGASFYIGFMVLVTLAPVLVLVGLGLAGETPLVDAFADPSGSSMTPEAATWVFWAFLAGIPGFLGYLAAGVDARSMATAVIGGRVEARPLRLAESIGIARARFWRMLGAQFLVGILAGLASAVVQGVATAIVGPVEPVLFAVSLLTSVLVSAPFVYVAAGIVLGEVGAVDAIGRSVKLVVLRKRLAVVVTLFSVFGQFVVLFGLSIGLDTIGRILIGTGLLEDFPRVLVVPLVAALVFAIGTLTFLVEAIAAAPAVHAFAALTHYTHGLELGRAHPAPSRNAFQPWFSKGLAAGAVLALVALVFGVLALPA